MTNCIHCYTFFAPIQKLILSKIHYPSYMNFVWAFLTQTSLHRGRKLTCTYHRQY